MTQQQKAIKAKLAESDIYPDKVVCKKDGTVEVKDSYFYRHGRSAETWSERVMEVLGDTAELVEARDDYKQWPGTSYFVAVVRGS